MSPQNIALVGIGKIARDQHAPAIEASPDWTLAATVSRNARLDGVEAFDKIETMLAARPDVAVVSFCTPPAPRFSGARAALAAGRDVMLEKPPGDTLSACAELEAEARRAGRTLFASWHSREAAAVDSARAWLAGKTVRRISIAWKEDVRRWHPGQTWIWEPGGFGVFDPGVNALSIATAILPGSLRISAAVLEIPENRATPIAARLRFAYGDDAEAVDATADFDWRRTGEQIWTIDVDTTAGALRLSEGGARLSIDGVAVPSGDDAGEYPRLYARMAALTRARATDFDVSPLRLAADAFLVGVRKVVAPFEEVE